MSEIDEARLIAQERVFAAAFAAPDLALARGLYQADVACLSPIVRLFGVGRHPFVAASTGYARALAGGSRCLTERWPSG